MVRHWVLITMRLCLLAPCQSALSPTPLTHHHSHVWGCSARGEGAQGHSARAIVDAILMPACQDAQGDWVISGSLAKRDHAPAQELAYRHSTILMISADQPAQCLIGLLNSPGCAHGQLRRPSGFRGCLWPPGSNWATLCCCKGGPGDSAAPWGPLPEQHGQRLHL